MSKPFYAVLRDSAHCRVCGKPATHEVRNSNNMVIEILCKKHAKARADYLNAGLKHDIK